VKYHFLPHPERTTANQASKKYAMVKEATAGIRSRERIPFPQQEMSFIIACVIATPPPRHACDLRSRQPPQGPSMKMTPDKIWGLTSYPWDEFLIPQKTIIYIDYMESRLIIKGYDNKTLYHAK
jgi:hypothetical protein